MKINVDELKNKLISIFQNNKMSYDDSVNLTEILIESSLLGQESHGIGRVFTYINAIKSNTILPKVKLDVITERPSFISFDANKSMGPLAVISAMNAIEVKVKQNGIAAFTLKNCGDIARLGTYAFYGAINNFITIVMANDSGFNPAVAPFGSNVRFFSTNPIAFGIPNKTSPIVADFSTSEQAIGKVKNAKRKNIKLKSKCLINKNNTFSDNPDDFLNGDAAILPFGGEIFGYKGTALSILVEALAGALSGGGVSSSKSKNGDENSVFVMMINAKVETNFSVLVQGLVKELEELNTHIPGSKKIDSITEIEIDDISWNEINSLIS